MSKPSPDMNGRTRVISRSRRRFGVLLNTLASILVLLWVAGCASYGRVENKSLEVQPDGGSYSIKTFRDSDRDSNLTLILTFSGGGTRAAALAYGVLEELRDTRVTIDGRSTRMLDEIDVISSVSGGSFTAAYFGLHGDATFESFEQKFLRFDLDKHLFYRLMNPVLWFGKKGRTDMAIEYYQKHIFQNAVFADMIRPNAPLIAINASDLARGVRFSFLQEYFNLLCSDLASFPLARAVAASSAVPVVFNPVVVQNYPGCDYHSEWLQDAEQRFEGNSELEMVTFGLETYADKQNRPFIHFVDGGITDNTGLRAIYDVIQVAGGAAHLFQTYEMAAPRQFVIIAVNASTESVDNMDLTNKQPSMVQSMNAMSDVQLHRYNEATIELVEQGQKSWAGEMSTTERPVTPYFIPVSFRRVKEDNLRLFLNKIPTSFSLSDEQVDELIRSGRELLRNSPVFQQLLLDVQQ